jgi:geranylgeranyl transferase type-2 subunit alpha
MLIVGIKRSPKSYTLWYHRQWAIELGIVEEKRSGGWQSPILDGELGLCSKMLQLDERNFHCWNYRLWVVGVYLQKIQEMCERTQEYTTFVQNECDMAEKMIKKNFSNYSAWHYRSKLMPKIYER